LVVFPNCKINLGLHVLGKRSDGFHDLETIFYPLPIHDALEILPSAENKTTCTTTGLSINVQSENNICTKAYELLKNDFPHLPTLQIHLHKVIPSGAGLGGGSSDAAYTLQLINKKWQLGLDESKLSEYAAELGSDCPFFTLNRPCLASGRGEILEPVSVDLSAYTIVVVHQGIHVATGWAFSKLQSYTGRTSLRDVIIKPIDKWKDELHNDFERPIFEHYPEIAGIKEVFYEKGALYSSLSGSGSAVYGLFPKSTELQFHFQAHYFIKIIQPG
jgi:4-diphosphocytidyl-2-C-methyl-D-erythritol kinase